MQQNLYYRHVPRTVSWVPDLPRIPVWLWKRQPIPTKTRAAQIWNKLIISSHHSILLISAPAIFKLARTDDVLKRVPWHPIASGEAMFQKQATRCSLRRQHLGLIAAGNLKSGWSVFWSDDMRVAICRNFSLVLRLLAGFAKDSWLEAYVVLVRRKHSFWNSVDLSHGTSRSWVILPWMSWLDVIWCGWLFPQINLDHIYARSSEETFLSLQLSSFSAV